MVILSCKSGLYTLFSHYVLSNKTLILYIVLTKECILNFRFSFCWETKDSRGCCICTEVECGNWLFKEVTVSLLPLQKKKNRSLSLFFLFSFFLSQKFDLKPNIVPFGYPDYWAGFMLPCISSKIINNHIIFSHSNSCMVIISNRKDMLVSIKCIFWKGKELKFFYYFHLQYKVPIMKLKE